MADKGDQAAAKSAAPKSANGKNEKGNNAKKVEELSEEDLKLKEELDLLVEVLKGDDAGLYQNALHTMRTLIRTATSSMTSVPKPLKFLRLRYTELVEAYGRWADTPLKRELADVLSVLAMTAAPTARETLKYRLLGSTEDLGSWGHEYVRVLTADVIKVFTERATSGQTPVDGNADLHTLAAQIVPFCISHNAEADAADLLMELETIDKIVPYVDEKNYERICLYLTSCVAYVPEPEDRQVLQAVLSIYRNLRKWPEALLISLRLFDQEGVLATFAACTDPVERNQLAFILAQHRMPVDVPSDVATIAGNGSLSDHFLALGRELDVLDPKSPEDIYKSHLEPSRPTLGVAVESSRNNLATSIVNGFVNAGFKSDTLMLKEGSNWLTKNKDLGQLAAVASVGMLYLWDIEGGFNVITEKYLELPHDHAKAGALLAIGIVSSGVKNEADAALAFLTDYVDSRTPVLRSAAILGLGIAFAGTRNARVAELLVPVLVDTSLSMEISAIAGLSLGLVFVSSCDVEIAERFLQTLLEREPGHLTDPMARFLALGLAFLYLGRQDAADATIEALKAVAQPLQQQVTVLVDACAYAGTGNVLLIQRMLQACTDHLEAGQGVFQGFATIGIAVIAMGEEIGNEMTRRMFNHLMQYGEPEIRRAVPLAAALLCTSNPQDVSLLDTISKYTHDNDAQTAQNAIYALGVIGAGTNNARVAQLLRHLASYHQKDAATVGVIRLAQGMLHLGKGTMTLNPYHSNRQLVGSGALAGLLTSLIAMTVPQNTIHGNFPYLFYALVPAMRPRVLITLNENLEAISVPVRVGKAVDTVGQAGRPKTITGFQTHTTPVLLGAGERAELATEDYISLVRILEGVVILRKNPDAQQ